MSKDVGGLHDLSTKKSVVIMVKAMQTTYQFHVMGLRKEAYL